MKKYSSRTGNPLPYLRSVKFFFATCYRDGCVMKISEKHGSRRRLSEGRTAPRRGLPAQRVSAAFRTFPLRQAPVPTSAAIFLIANPELEFRVSCSKQRTAAKSNRKKIAISCLPFSAFSGSEPQAASLQNLWPPYLERLIVTPRLEFRATLTKQTSSSISNRYKTHFSPYLPWPSCFRASMPCRLAATRLTRYNSGSHIEVNQP